MTERLWITVADVLRIVDANSTRQKIEQALIANLPRNGGASPRRQAFDTEVVVLWMNEHGDTRRTRAPGYDWPLYASGALPPLAKEVYIGSRFAVSWVPQGFGAWRAYCGAGWRFLQLWRVRFAVKWAYE